MDNSKVLKQKLNGVKQSYIQTRKNYPELARQYRRAGKAIERQIDLDKQLHKTLQNLSEVIEANTIINAYFEAINN